MLNIIQNTIGAIRRVGESVVRAGLKMWLPFTKAEPLGDELVTNGDFATDSDWLTGTGISISNNAINFTSQAGEYGSQPINIRDGVAYKINFEITTQTSGQLTIFLGAGNNVGLVSGLGKKEIIALADTSFDTRIYFGNVFSGSITNVSVEEYAQETPDISGNDNNAILKTGKCLTFTGNDSVDTSFPSNKTIKTIAFWIYPTHTSSAEAIFYGGGGTGGTREIRLAGSDSELESINENIVMDTYVDGVYRGVTYGGTPAQLELDQWQRVALTSSTGFSVVNDTFNIGDGLYAADGRFKMSDLQIYGAEFTTDDIAYDYANPQKLVTDNASSNVTLNDLHAWWHMSEGDGTVAFDSAPLIGKELVTNGDFSTDGILTSSSWTLGWATTDIDGTNISDGVLNLINDDDSDFDGRAYATNGADNYLDLQSGKTYSVTYTILENTDNAVIRFYFGFYTDAPNTVGTHTIVHTQSGTSLRFVARNASNNTTIKISSISAKEVFNIDGETYHGSSLGATYDDAQERIPQLGMMNWSKGSNLIEYSEDFSDGYWDNAGVTLDSGYLAPDGTMSAYKLSADVSGSGSVNNLFSGIGSYYRSIWAKTTSGTGTVALMTRHDSTGSGFTITNEWQRFSINSADSLADYFYVVDFRAGNLDEVILWGAQLEDADSVSAYRRTNGTAVTDATLISCATDSQKDILGNAVRIKGSGFNLDGTGYAEVLDDNDFDIPACNTVDEGAFSFMGWAKFKYKLQGGSSYNVIYNNGISMTQTGTFSIASSNSNKITAWVNGTLVNSTTTHSDGDWVHFTLTRGVDGSVKLYINKTLENTVTQSAFLSNTENKKIGWDNTNGDRFYNELIDDLKLYNRELSSDEIEQNYKATKSGHNN